MLFISPVRLVQSVYSVRHSAALIGVLLLVGLNVISLNAAAADAINGELCLVDAGAHTASCGTVPEAESDEVDLFDTCAVVACSVSTPANSDNPVRSGNLYYSNQTSHMHPIRGSPLQLPSL